MLAFGHGNSYWVGGYDRKNHSFRPVNIPSASLPSSAPSSALRMAVISDSLSALGYSNARQDDITKGISNPFGTHIYRAKTSEPPPKKARESALRGTPDGWPPPRTPGHRPRAAAAPPATRSRARGPRGGESFLIKLTRFAC